MTNSVSSSTNQKKYDIGTFLLELAELSWAFEQAGEFRVAYVNEFDKRML